MSNRKSVWWMRRKIVFLMLLGFVSADLPLASHSTTTSQHQQPAPPSLSRHLPFPSSIHSHIEHLVNTYPSNHVRHSFSFLPPSSSSVLPQLPSTPVLLSRHRVPSPSSSSLSSSSSFLFSSSSSSGSKSSLSSSTSSSCSSSSVCSVDLCGLSSPMPPQFPCFVLTALQQLPPYAATSMCYDSNSSITSTACSFFQAAIQFYNNVPCDTPALNASFTMCRQDCEYVASCTFAQQTVSSQCELISSYTGCNHFNTTYFPSPAIPARSCPNTYNAIDTTSSSDYLLGELGDYYYRLYSTNSTVYPLPNRVWDVAKFSSLFPSECHDWSMVSNALWRVNLFWAHTALLGASTVLFAIRYKQRRQPLTSRQPFLTAASIIASYVLQFGLMMIVMYGGTVRCSMRLFIGVYLFPLLTFLPFISSCRLLFLYMWSQSKLQRRRPQARDWYADHKYMLRTPFFLFCYLFQLALSTAILVPFYFVYNDYFNNNITALDSGQCWWWEITPSIRALGLQGGMSWGPIPLNPNGWLPSTLEPSLMKSTPFDSQNGYMPDFASCQYCQTTDLQISVLVAWIIVFVLFLIFIVIALRNLNDQYGLWRECVAGCLIFVVAIVTTVPDYYNSVESVYFKNTSGVRVDIGVILQMIFVSLYQYLTLLYPLYLSFLRQYRLGPHLHPHPSRGGRPSTQHTQSPDEPSSVVSSLPPISSSAALTREFILDDIVTKPDLLQLFRQFSVECFAVENCEFFVLASQWKMAGGHDVEEALYIYETFVKADAPLQVNISGPEQAALQNIFERHGGIESITVRGDEYDKALKTIRHLIHINTWPKFLHSSMYREFRNLLRIARDNPLVLELGAQAAPTLTTTAAGVTGIGGDCVSGNGAEGGLVGGRGTMFSSSHASRVGGGSFIHSGGTGAGSFIHSATGITGNVSPMTSPFTGGAMTLADLAIASAREKEAAAAAVAGGGGERSSLNHMMNTSSESGMPLLDSPKHSHAFYNDRRANTHARSVIAVSTTASPSATAPVAVVVPSPISTLSHARSLTNVNSGGSSVRTTGSFANTMNQPLLKQNVNQSSPPTPAPATLTTSSSGYSDPNDRSSPLPPTPVPTLPSSPSARVPPSKLSVSQSSSHSTSSSSSSSPPAPPYKYSTFDSTNNGLFATFGDNANNLSSGNSFLINTTSSQFGSSFSAGSGSSSGSGSGINGNSFVNGLSGQGNMRLKTLIADATVEETEEEIKMLNNSAAPSPRLESQQQKQPPLPSQTQQQRQEEQQEGGGHAEQVPSVNSTNTNDGTVLTISTASASSSSSSTAAVAPSGSLEVPSHYQYNSLKSRAALSASGLHSDPPSPDGGSGSGFMSFDKVVTGLPSSTRALVTGSTTPPTTTAITIAACATLSVPVSTSSSTAVTPSPSSTRQLSSSSHL